jgi:hypothetical protein
VKPGDLVISNANLTQPDGFVIRDAITREILHGPIQSLHDAVSAARALRPDATIWSESTDARGRVFGVPIRLDGTPSGT